MFYLFNLKEFYRLYIKLDSAIDLCFSKKLQIIQKYVFLLIYKELRISKKESI